MLEDRVKHRAEIKSKGHSATLHDTGLIEKLRTQRVFLCSEDRARQRGRILSLDTVRFLKKRQGTRLGDELEYRVSSKS